jgi:hypothetical protein
VTIRRCYTKLEQCSFLVGLALILADSTQCSRGVKLGPQIGLAAQLGAPLPWSACGRLCGRPLQLARVFHLTSLFLSRLRCGVSENVDWAHIYIVVCDTRRGKESGRAKFGDHPVKERREGLQQSFAHEEWL